MILRSGCAGEMCWILICSSAIDLSCSDLSNIEFSGEGKLIFEGVKVEIVLVAFERRYRASTI